MTEDSFKTFNWKPELRKKFFTKEQQSPEKLLFPDLRMKSGIQNLVRQKFQQILDTQTKIGFEAAYFITYHYSNPYERKPNEEFMTYKYKDNMITNSVHCPSIELNLIWNEKIFMIQRALKINPFLSDFFMRIDAGICVYRNNSPPSISFPNINVLNKLPKYKFIYCSTYNTTYSDKFQ